MNDTVAKARRRAKIAAIAKTADYNPAEAAVAQAMLEALPEARLDVISDDIKHEWGKGIEAAFAVGHLLGEARAHFVSDKEFGRWIKSQEFPFGRGTEWNLRKAAEREDEVRAFMATHKTVGGQDLAVTTAYVQMTSAPKLPVADVGPTVPVDPAFAALREAHRLIVDGDAFLTMHVDDLHASAGFIKELVAAYQEAKAKR